MSKIYRLICILDSIKGEDKAVSCEYLHIHILKSDLIATIDEFAKTLAARSKNYSLFQWGALWQKDVHVRSVKVLASEIKKFGQIGIGAAARGNNEQAGDFIGGGEGFLFNLQNFRITKGNQVFKALNDQGYWTFQVADFNGAEIFDADRKIIKGRKELLRILKDKSGGRAFVAVFDAKFEGDFFARSNGVFPEDNVTNSTQLLFDKEIKGGHLVGGSSDNGDILSLKERFTQEKACLIDFAFTITSNILLKPVNEVLIIN